MRDQVATRTLHTAQPARGRRGAQFAALLVFCAWAAPAAAWNIETVDPNPDVGDYSSLALGSGGLPRIVYWDANNTDLKYAEFDGTNWTIQVAHSDMSGQDISLVLDSAGTPHILHIDVSPSPARLVHTWRDGSNWLSETLDDFVLGGIVADIDEADTLMTSYVVSIYPNTYLRFARRAAGGAWQTGLIAQSPGFASAALRLDRFRLPHVAAQDIISRTESNIRYFHFTGTAWEEGTAIPTSSGLTSLVSIALDAQDQPSLTFNGPGAVVASSTNQGQTWTLETVDPVGQIHGRSAIEVDASGVAHLVYWISEGDLLTYAWKSGAAWNTTAVDVTGEAGGSLASTYALVVDPAGLPRISYGLTFADENLRNLRFATVDGVFSVRRILMKGVTSGNRFAVGARATLRDGSGAPVPGASVESEWTLPDSSTLQQTQTTNARGNATFAVTSTTGGTWTICVLNASRADLLYRPDLNTETCDSITYP